MPVALTRPSCSTSASAASTGALVRTGEAIRMRRRARSIRVAIWWASSRPRPGQNHGRTSASPILTAGRVEVAGVLDPPRAPELLERALIGLRERLRDRR